MPLTPGSPDWGGSRSAPTPAQGGEGVVTGTLPGGPLHLEALAIVVGLKWENAGLTAIERRQHHFDAWNHFESAILVVSMSDFMM